MYSCGLAAVNQRQSTAIDAIRPAMVFCYPILLYCHTKHLISCYLIFIYITAYRTKCYKSFVFDVLLGAYQIIQHKHTSINKVQGGIQGDKVAHKVSNSYLEECRQILRSLLRSIEPKTQEQRTQLPLSLPSTNIYWWQKKRLNLH